MTGERRQDVFLIALVLSAALHVGLMYWVRSQVMTHVSSPRRAPKHIPVTMKDAPQMASPKEIAEFVDEEARKLAPSAEGAKTAPTAVDALPMPTERFELKAPASPTVPATVKLDIPIDTPVKAASTVIGRSDVLSYAGSDLVVEMPALSATAAAPISVPTVPAAVIAAPNFAATTPASIKRVKTAKAKYVVPKEMMDEVNERFVESEKEAVRQLFEVDDALDMTKAVSIRLEKSVSGGWTYFRATVTPKLNLPSVPKDVVVLLDASGSIGFDRLASCRKAAKRILRTCTNTGDRFNLVAFRDRFSYAFRTWQECDATSFEAGDKWLANLVAHGRTDVFATIRSVLTLPRDPKRPLIAMVITDGDANSGVSETKEILSKFTALNDGLVSVYMYGVRGSANRELIDVLTHGNRGESFVYDSWQAWNAGEGIEGLTERFRDPLITDLRVLFSSSLRAVSYPTAVKNLYRGNSVTITGRVPGAPASLDFSLKGLAGDNVYEGFFRIPFATAAVDAKLADSFAAEAALAATVR